MPVILEDGYRMDMWEDILPVLEDFSQKSGYAIRALNSCCNLADVKESEEEFYIRFYAAPREYHSNRRIGSIEKVFGVPLGDYSRSITPDETHPMVVRDDGDVIVAEVHKQTLFVLFELPIVPEAGMLMSRILETCVASGFIDRDPEKLRVAKEERERQVIAQSKSNFQIAYRQSLEMNIRRSRERARDLSEREKDLLRRLEQVKASRASVHNLFRQAKSVLRSAHSRVIDQIYENLQHMSVDGVVKVVGNAASMDMGHVDITFQNTVYDIGDFTLVLDLTRRDSLAVKLLNRTRVVRDHAHPHIRANGEVCFGNMYDQVDSLVQSMDLEVLVSLIKTVLQTYTERDAYCRIELWPIKPKER